ncbi:hypothetical protein EST38_g10448 [Candolleomyces aberdarensis]|uniref:Magnesium transporter n=1 Tax=Candolleomyces aberdarensis TaxID=2316362 RepID=A0A4Q2D8Y8_9AGAR|nr:hypothetical protein EST38_g10448 [Candolleomyces aberdarensis]
MIHFFVPKYGKTNPLVGHNQFTHFSTYLFGATVAGCIIVQMNYFNKALDTFSTNVVNPMYYVGFSTATLVASIILFQGFNTDDTANAVSLLTGFVVTFLGVHLLNLSRTPEPPIDHDHGPPHSALEGRLMHPRPSLQGPDVHRRVGRRGCFTRWTTQRTSRPTKLPIPLTNRHPL